MRSVPTFHPLIHQTPQVRSFTPGRTFQHTPTAGVRPSYSGSRTLFHPGGHGIFANPVRREVTRHVRFHGGVLALPALVTLGMPVLLDIPFIGQVSVPEETYSTLYPLLSSDDEADREQAYRQLQEQVEHQPESLIQAANVSAGRPSSLETCPGCPECRNSTYLPTCGLRPC